MTYADIEGDARTLIQDAVVPYRFAGAEIYGYVSSGLRALFSIRPVAFFVNGRMPSTEAAMEPPTVAAASAAGGVVDAPVSARWQECLAYYAASKCLERDNADTQNLTLSGEYMKKFAELARM